ALLVPGPDVQAMAASALGASGEAEVALASGHFVRLLRARIDDSDYRDAAAQTFAAHATTERKDEVQAFLLRQLWPEAAAKPAAAPLARFWPFVTAAGLERPLAEALARRWTRAVPGPWQAETSAPFIEAVRRGLVGVEHRQA